MLHQRLGVAQGDSDGTKLQLVQRSGGSGLVGLELDGDHSAGQTHLLFSDLMAREGVQTRIVHLRHGGVAREELRNLPRIGAVTLHPDIQRLQSPGDQERIKGAHNRAGHILQTEHAALGDEVLFADYHARDHVAMAVEVLGRAVDHHVGAPAQRLLQIRRAEGVVHDDPDLGVEGVGRLGDQLNVQQLQRGVAGGLEVDHLGLVGKMFLEIFNVGQIRQRHLHAELAHTVVEQCVGAAIQRFIRHDLIAAHHRAPKSGGDGAHTGRSSHRGLAALQGCQLCLYRRQGWIPQPGVDVAALFPGEPGAALLHRGEGKCGRLINGSTQGTGSVFHLAGMDLTCGETELLLRIHRNAFLSSSGPAAYTAAGKHLCYHFFVIQAMGWTVCDA